MKSRNKRVDGITISGKRVDEAKYVREKTMEFLNDCLDLNQSERCGWYIKKTEGFIRQIIKDCKPRTK